MDEQKSVIPNGCPRVPDGGIWLRPKFGWRGARIGFTSPKSAGSALNQIFTNGALEIFTVCI
jgi:hypothetical protein